MIVKTAKIMELAESYDSAGAVLKQFTEVGEGKFYEITDEETLKYVAFSPEIPEVRVIAWLSSTIPSWVKFDNKIYRVRSIRKTTYWPRGRTILVLEEYKEEVT